MRKATHFVLSQGEELVWIVEGVYADGDKASEAAARLTGTRRCAIARLVPATNPKGKTPKGKSFIAGAATEGKAELKGGKL